MYNIILRMQNLSNMYPTCHCKIKFYFLYSTVASEHFVSYFNNLSTEISMLKDTLQSNIKKKQRFQRNEFPV